MQTSNKSTSWVSIYIVVLIIAITSFWFSQSSINNYWMQTYHKESPLSVLNKYSWWTYGDDIKKKIDSVSHDITDWLNDKNEQWGQATASNLNAMSEMDDTEEPAPEVLHQASLQDADVKINSENQNNTPQPLEAEGDKSNLITAPTTPSIENVGADSVSQDTIPQSEEMGASGNTEVENTLDSFPQEQKVILSKNDKVFFAGDSLMQGVAPHVQKWLKKEFNIESVNLSKQSTGLSYPSFFDWPLTIENTIKSDKNIKLLVVFLGANDSWDFPNPKQPHKAYLKFKTEEWESVYRQRIQRIIDFSLSRGVKIIWVEVPYMKKATLNSQMLYLNELYHSEVDKKGIFVAVADSMSLGDKKYSDSIYINDKLTRLRSKDGIHFTSKGQQFIAEKIQEYIGFNVK